MTEPARPEEVAAPIPIIGSGPEAEPVPVTLTGPALPSSDTQQLTTTPETATSGEVIRQQVSSQDYVVLRLAVIGLMVAILICLLGAIVLAWQGKDLPDGLVAIGSASVGALATMLVRPPLYPEQPQYIGDRRATK